MVLDRARRWPRVRSRCSRSSLPTAPSRTRSVSIERLPPRSICSRRCIDRRRRARRRGPVPAAVLELLFSGLEPGASEQFPLWARDTAAWLAAGLGPGWSPFLCAVDDRSSAPVLVCAGVVSDPSGALGWSAARRTSTWSDGGTLFGTYFMASMQKAYHEAVGVKLGFSPPFIDDAVAVPMSPREQQAMSRELKKRGALVDEAQAELDTLRKRVAELQPAQQKFDAAMQLASALTRALLQAGKSDRGLVDRALAAEGYAMRADDKGRHRIIPLVPDAGGEPKPGAPKRSKKA